MNTGISHTFTASGQPEAEELLRRTLDGIRQDLRFCPPGTEIHLGGSYGRGDGGVLQTPGGAALFNDLDFFVFTPEWQFHRRAFLARHLKEIADKWQSVLGIEVDFSPAKGALELLRHGRRLMYQELRQGHVTLAGSGALLRLIPDLPPSRLPVTEGFRLLLNRGMGLLLAGEALRSSAPDAGFILRNFSKLMLGAADALLILRHQYQWSRPAREELLSRLLPEEDFLLYREAARFKTAPRTVLPDRPEQLYLRLQSCFLRVVRRITGVSGEAACILPELTAICRREHETSLVNWLNTGRRTGCWSPRPSRFLSPAVQLLDRMYIHVRQNAGSIPAVPADLHRDWLIFN